MKKTIFISILIAILAMSFTPNNTSELEINTGMFGGNGGFWFSINGEISNDYIDDLFEKFPETKRKGFKWKFNNVSIPGIEKPVTFQVHQGVRYEIDKGGTGFYTYTKKTEEYLKCKEEKSEKIEKEVIIYIHKSKFNRKSVIKTESEKELVKKYLCSLYNK